MIDMVVLWQKLSPTCFCQYKYKPKSMFLFHFYSKLRFTTLYKTSVILTYHLVKIDLSARRLMYLLRQTKTVRPPYSRWRKHPSIGKQRTFQDYVLSSHYSYKKLDTEFSDERAEGHLT